MSKLDEIRFIKNLCMYFDNIVHIRDTNTVFDIYFHYQFADHISLYLKLKSVQNILRPYQYSTHTYFISLSVKHKIKENDFLSTRRLRISRPIRRERNWFANTIVLLFAQKRLESIGFRFLNRHVLLLLGLCYDLGGA